MQEREGQIQADYQEVFVAFTNAGVSHRLVLQSLSQRTHAAIPSVILLLVALLRYPFVVSYFPCYRVADSAIGVSIPHVVKDCLLKKEEDEFNDKRKGGPTRNVFPHNAGGGAYGHPDSGK